MHETNQEQNKMETGIKEVLSKRNIPSVVSVFCVEVEEGEPTSRPEDTGR